MKQINKHKTQKKPQQTKPPQKHLITHINSDQVPLRKKES